MALEAELADAKHLLLRLFDISVQSEADAVKARTDFKSRRVRLGAVEQTSKLASAYSDAAQKQDTEWTKATKEALPSADGDVESSPAPLE